MLNGARILVTRPEHQAENLCRLLAEAGGRAVRFPVLATAAITDGKIAEILATLDKFQWLVFISANAVNFAVQANGGKINPNQAAVAAIGQATASALRQAGITVDLWPSPPYNSAALLAMEPMQQVNGQRFLIIRGDGGRDELADSLRQRGARVDYLEVYRRTMPTTDCSEVNALLTANQLDVVTVTSGEALQSLLTMIDRRYRPALLALPLVVISDRIKQIAAEMGFNRIAVANQASDVAILEAVTMMMTGEMGWQN